MSLLEIYIADNWTMVVIIAVIIVIIWLLNSIFAAIKYKKELKNKQVLFEQRESDLRLNIYNLAIEKFQEFKEAELYNYQKIIKEATLKECEALLRGWIIDEEKGLRKDAVTRSMGVNLGKITEHLVPFSKHLEDFNPRDIRFIGSPVDLMIFDGATESRSIIDIYFVEIKTGTGQLSKKQKTIRDAIEGQRIHWLPIIVPQFKWDVPDDDI